MFIDARGCGCPKPVMMAEEALSNMDEGTIEILADNEASAENLKRFATKNGFYPETAREDNHWRTKIVKSYVCEMPAEESKSEVAQAPGKDLLLVIATDTMGKDEELGKILMKGFFETMKIYKEIPHTIFFLNTGVRLTATNETMIPIIKELEAMGVEIFICGTCLKYYNLESELKVGFRGTANHIVEGVKDFKKTVYIG